MSYSNTTRQGKEKKKESLKDYVEVNERIEKFWQEYPNGRIETEIVSIKSGLIIMRAYVYKQLTDDKPSACGTAYEREGSNFINETSALENCETSAVGRALAMMGYEIKRGIASKEEIDIANQKRERMKKEQELAKAAMEGKDIASLSMEDFHQNQTAHGRKMFQEIRKLWEEASGGDFEGFAEWYAKRAKAGKSNDTIYLSLFQQIEQRKQEEA